MALIAAIQGEAHARFVQLMIEYDPAPPFDGGSPDRADPAALETYHALAKRLNPDRVARMERLAAELRS